jgi:hypothetical protein
MTSREHLFIFTLNNLRKIRIGKRGYFFTLNYLPNKPRKIRFNKNSRYGLTKKNNSRYGKYFNVAKWFNVSERFNVSKKRTACYKINPFKPNFNVPVFTLKSKTHPPFSFPFSLLLIQPCRLEGKLEVDKRSK